MAKKITVEFTEAQLQAVIQLADCASNTYEDALGVLDTPGKVRAGYRGLEAMNAALYKKK